MGIKIFTRGFLFFSRDIYFCGYVHLALLATLNSTNLIDYSWLNHFLRADYRSLFILRRAELFFDVITAYLWELRL
jgi:hypothetical protein